MTPAPLFLVGAPRSGTTLLYKALYDLFDPLARRRGGPYLQKDQTLERLTKRPAHVSPPGVYTQPT